MFRRLTAVTVFVVITVLLFVLSIASLTSTPVLASGNLLQTPTATPPTTEPLDLDLTPPTRGDFDPDTVADIDLNDYPALPQVTAHTRLIYEEGLAQGNNPHVFSKVGDCMTAAAEFLIPFGMDEYDLGDYETLQEVVDWYAGVPARQALRGEDWELDSFANPGLSTASGFNAASILDALWANPTWCQANESPLACEYRVSQPALAVIMFGTNDVFYLEAEAFDFYLRNVALATIDSGVVPVLNTFPIRPEFPDKSLLFNQIVIQVATDYDLPLINLWLALQELPNQGVDTVQTIHLTVPEDGQTGIFDSTHLEAGYTYRNLVTLQALDVLWRDLTLPEEE